MIRFLFIKRYGSTAKNYHKILYSNILFRCFRVLCTTFPRNKERGNMPNLAHVHMLRPCFDSLLFNWLLSSICMSCWATNLDEKQLLTCILFLMKGLQGKHPLLFRVCRFCNKKLHKGGTSLNNPEKHSSILISWIIEGLKSRLHEKERKKSIYTGGKRQGSCLMKNTKKSKDLC